MVFSPRHALDALQILRGPAINVLPHGHGAYKGYALDIRMVAEKVHLLGRAVNNLEHTLRGPGLFEKLGQKVRGHGIPLGGLENKGVPTSNGHGEHPKGNHGREVEGRNAPEHAQGLTQGIAVDAAGHVFHRLPHEEGRNVRRLLHHLDAPPDVALGVLEGLSRFLGQHRGNFVMALLQQRLIAQHEAGAFRHGNLFPAGESHLRRGHGLGHFLIGRHGHFTEDLLRGRVAYGQPFRGGALNKRPIDVLRKPLGHASLLVPSKVR